MNETFTVVANGARLAGESAGTGSPVVFLHAGVADRRMWRTEMDRLKKTHRVIAYDRRGFGETESAPLPFSHVDDLEAVLDQLGCETATLVGCSQGGRISIDLALV